MIGIWYPLYKGFKGKKKIVAYCLIDNEVAKERFGEFAYLNVVENSGGMKEI